MDRRKFLQVGSLSALGLFLGGGLMNAGFAHFTASFNGQLLPLRGTSSLFFNKGGNVGVFEVEDGFVIVDSQFPQFIAELLSTLKQSGKPILYLANTHHHGDHTSGNIAFTDLKVGIVAHKTVPSSQKEAAVLSGSLDKQKYANILFDKEFKFDLGSSTLKGYHFGSGNTRGDAMYHFEDDNVVHMGDLMFKDMIPVFRKKDDASLTGWVEILNRAIGFFDKETLFIFGHGPEVKSSYGTREDLLEMKNFLEASHQFILKSIEKGQTTQELLKEHKYILGFPNRETPQRFESFIDEVRSTLL